MAEYNRYEAPMAPGSHWPDGSPVSNWSQAVATLARHGSVAGHAIEHLDASHRACEQATDAESFVCVTA